MCNGKEIIKRIPVIIAIAVIITVMSSAIASVNPVPSYAAAADPWDAYKQYIPDTTPVVKRQLRGMWISTAVNLDWPSLAARNIANDAERIRKSKEELAAILDKAVEMNMNAVFFQVSPEGDAFYKSDIVNWSRYLTGTFGRDPGFDPLAFAIEEAHRRNLEIHAWFNPYRVSMTTGTSVIDSLNIGKSVYKDHPGWIRSSMDRFIVDPGIPDAREWVVGRVMEVVDKYDIDGIHFDDYFYYEKYAGEMNDDETFRKYNDGMFSNKADWRRNNTYLLIKELSRRIRQAKPWVKFGISPAGVWGNKADGHPEGSDTNASYTNYENSFIDTKKWVDEELLDYIAPQDYFSFAYSRASYGEIADWWADVCEGKNVHLYIGQALFKINDDPDLYFNGDDAVQEFARQLKFDAVRPGIEGGIMFRASNFNNWGKRQVAGAIKGDLWSKKALVPVMPWKGGSAPTVPSQGKTEAVSTGGADGLRITWNDNDSKTAYFAVYRFNKGENADISSDACADNLIGTVRKNCDGVQEFTDTGAGYGAGEIDPCSVFYVITALDRLHNESGGLVTGIGTSCGFYDVGGGFEWASDAIAALYERGIVKGNGRGLFYPGCGAKRGDFILMVARALKLQADYSGNFIDVPADSYYYDAIGIAKAFNIARGYNELFYPDNCISREDMMVIVARALEATDTGLASSGNAAVDGYLARYSDSMSISGYARDAVAELTKAGLVTGAGGKLYPKSAATRAEIAVILNRALHL